MTDKSRKYMLGNGPTTYCCKVSFTCNERDILHTKDIHLRSVLNTSYVILPAHLAGVAFGRNCETRIYFYTPWMPRFFRVVFR